MRDYEVATLHNDLCSTYPKSIYILESDKRWIHPRNGSYISYDICRVFSADVVDSLVHDIGKLPLTSM